MPQVPQETVGDKKRNLGKGKGHRLHSEKIEAN